MVMTNRRGVTLDDEDLTFVVLPLGGGGLDVRSTGANLLLELYGIQCNSGQR